jgi:flagellar biosynthetic protein FliP
MSRRLTLLLALAAAMATLLALASPALAQSLTLNLGGQNATAQDGSVAGRVVQLVALLTVLSLAPSILVMMTSFTRIIVVLSFLRTAMGLQQTPPNAVLISLALFLTAFIMAPTLQSAYETGIRPLMAQEIDEITAFDRTVAPMRDFMLAHVREQDLALFADMAKTGKIESPEQTPLQVLIPAFMISELKRAFEIGFLLFVPFLIIDMVVASILMSMGMMMLPPIVVSLPFKIIFFVLVDGWYLVVGSLVQGYGTG